jgi:hypothetical protein
MGNTESNNYITGEELSDSSIDDPVLLPVLPPIKHFHSKGKPYGAMLNIQLKSKFPYQWGYCIIYDLRTGNKSPWWFDLNIYGDELQFKLHITFNNTIMITFPLKYSSESNIYTTVLKGCKNSNIVKFELFADNIHCQRITGLKLTLAFKIWGFITFDKQDKIPIAFGNF